MCGSCLQELSVELYILHEGTYIRVSQSHFRPNYKLHSDFYMFENFHLLSQAPGCDV